MYFTFKSVLVLCLLLNLVCINGYEVLEGKYKGEVYRPARNYASRHLSGRSSSNSHKRRRVYEGTDRANIGPPVSPPAAKEFSSGSGLGTNRALKSKGRSISGVFSNLIQQLSSALHKKIIGNSEPTVATQNPKPTTEVEKSESRSYGTNDRRNGDDLYYNFYPHNQHLFNLPECATQQVCNAVYVRLNFTQPLCACPQVLDPCSTSYLSDDDHTIKLQMDKSKTKAITLVKTCETVSNVRICRTPRDWAILALQNTRTGKAHYLVICKCPDDGKLEGPLNHDQPSYAQVPGIRVYGMMCTQNKNRFKRSVSESQDNDLMFPWETVQQVMKDGTIVRDLLE